jgi:hypothetical protein
MIVAWPGDFSHDRFHSNVIPPIMLCYPTIVQQPVKERIAKLREEIAQISEANRLYLQGNKNTPGAADQERRLRRLQEIMDELMSLTDWKKP